MNNIFAEKLKELREEKELTQDVLAEKLSISRSTVGMLELGTRMPSIEVLVKIADFFNVSIDYLLGKPENRTEPVKHASDNDPKVQLKQLLVKAGYHNIPKEILEMLQLILAKYKKADKT